MVTDTSIADGAKRGYLHEDFRLFHIRDRRELAIEYHYHEFDKIVVFLSGKVNYIMEGKSYFLQPWDILLVSHNQIHRPIIDASTPYERIILWMNTDYLLRHSAPGENLLECFSLALDRNFALIRPDPPTRQHMMQLLLDTEEALNAKEFGHDLLSRTCFLQFMILLNRTALMDDTQRNTAAYKSDPKFAEIIAYINANLSDDLSLDALCARFYISKSYLMHRFRDMAGCTAHSYIQQKRLIQATQLIRGGMPVLAAGAQCGFHDYSAFLRAFKRMYGSTPREML